MPARKHRSGKHGTISAEEAEAKAKEARLLHDLRTQQATRIASDGPLWVSWMDMRAAKSLERQGFLRESPHVIGCFFLID